MDIPQREGFYPPPQGSSTILGVEFSGHVSEVGAGVTAWAANDEVFGLTGGVRIGGLFIILKLIPCMFLGCLCRVYRRPGNTSHA